MNKIFTYLGSRAFSKNLIIAVVATGTLIITLSYIFKVYTRHGDGLLVPKLRGIPIENAIQALESQGLQYQIDSVYVADKAPGVVIEQNPVPHTNVKTSRTIYLTIATRQAPNATFPDVEGKTFLEAQAILINYGFKVGDTTYTSGVARDIVLKLYFGEQIMEKGQVIHKGSRINIVLGDGKGASEVDIPNLVGLNLNEARLALLGSSLELGNVTFESSDKDSLHAKVIKQLPAPSDTLSKINIGTKVDVLLGK